MALADTLTTREAVRRAALEDIIARCELASVSIEGGELDGVKVVSMGTLRDQVTGALLVRLAPPSDRFAEVSTPATITVSAGCPECKLPVSLTVKLTPQLTVNDSGAEIALKAKASKMPHIHGQLTLPTEADGQVSMDELVIDDLRIKILNAVEDLNVGHAAEHEPGPPPTLDNIAVRLELATEHERGDLEESLYRYSQLEDPLIRIVSVAGEPVTYELADAGQDLLDESEVEADDEPGEAPA